jgi:hypothetical protein
MTRTHKLLGAAAAVLMMVATSTAPAKAQFAGGGGGQDMMTQMAPMLEMMKAKMGKKRFASLMQTMGPMMSNMMDGSGGGFGGMNLGGFSGGNFGSTGLPSIGGDYGNLSGGSLPFIGGGAGGFNAGDMMSMIPQFMSLANMGGGTGHHRRHARHKS